MFSVYDTLSPLGQALHSAHVLFSALAAVLATIPLLTDKGSVLQRWGGRIFLALSGLACLIGFGLGLQEHSLLLLAFQVFFLYLLLGGWRAAQLSESGRLITFDIVLIGLLAGLALVMFAAAFVTDDAVRRFYLGFFVLCAAIMAWRDAQRLQKHLAWQRLRRFLGAFDTPPDHWLGRYASMMAGSVIVNLTVVVLSFLPHDWHWLWPVLLLIGSWLLINRRARQRQQQLRELVLWQRH